MKDNCKDDLLNQTMNRTLTLRVKSAEFACGKRPEGGSTCE